MQAPPSDAVLRCRDAVETVSAAALDRGTIEPLRQNGLSLIQDRGELINILTSPHFQVRYYNMMISKTTKTTCLMLCSRLIGLASGFVE